MIYCHESDEEIFIEMKKLLMTPSLRKLKLSRRFLFNGPLNLSFGSFVVLLCLAYFSDLRWTHFHFLAINCDLWSYKLTVSVCVQKASLPGTCGFSQVVLGFHCIFLWRGRGSWKVLFLRVFRPRYLSLLKLLLEWFPRLLLLTNGGCNEDP